MTANDLIFNEFISFLKNKNKVVNDTIRIVTSIIYKWDNESKEAEEFDIELVFNMQGMSYGQITILNGRKISPNNVLTQIDINYENTILKITSNNALILTGNTPMMGTFKVIIYPN